MNLIRRVMTQFFYRASWSKITLILFVCWLPYCVMHYPMRFGGGSQNMIDMLYGIETLARNMSSTIYEGHYISNHHPVLLTLYYGLFFRLGDLIGHKNIAAFLLSLTNLFICSGCMGYAISTLRKYMGKRGFYICLLFVIVNPIYGMYAYTCCKDNIFVAVLILFFTVFFEVAVTDGEILREKSKNVVLWSSVLLLPFLKNQGLIVVLISLLIGGVYIKAIRKRLFVIIACVLISYPIIFCNIIMPLFKVSPGGRQEALSVPFNQTAAYYKKYSDEITTYENEMVDRVLPTNQLAELYEEDCADNVKFTFKQKATNDDLISYFEVYINQFFKHPRIYIEAWYNLVGGYFNVMYDDIKSSLSGTVNCQGVKSPKWVSSVLRAETFIYEKVIDIPIVSCFVRPAFYSYLLFITVAIYTCFAIKHKKEKLTQHVVGGDCPKT